MKIFPPEGRDLRDPFTKQLVPADGIEVDDNNALWAWLIAQGDARTELPAQAKPKKDDAQ